MVADPEGFLQPQVDAAQCVHCGKCESVCPVLHPGKSRQPLAVYAAKAKDDELRKISSSGGIFSLLARQVMARGGVVFGAAFEPKTFRVIHQAARNEEELDALRGSKYVQSDLGNTFAEVRDLLRQGIEVLYSGCPCQIAGLRNFLGGESSNLLTVEVICHAAPSPLAWQKYLSCQEKAQGNKITRTFSRRWCDWKRYALALEFKDSSASAYLVNPASKSYLEGFGNELFSRRSCYHCTARAFSSGADLTIGDFWGIEKTHPEFDDNVGVSAVLALTEDGLSRLKMLDDHMVSIPSSIEAVFRDNRTVYRNHKASRRRERFFKEVTDSNFDVLVERLVLPPLWYRVLRWIKWHTIGRPKES